MPFALLKYGLSRKYPARRDIPAPTDLKPSYDVVIIGGGGHGLATAYYLAKAWGITNVCVLEKGYLGGGNTARNTAVIRSNYITPESVRFYKEGVELFGSLANELGFNMLYSQRGQLTLAHSDATVRTFRLRAEVNKHCGVRSEMVGRDEIREIVPCLDLDENARYPILGGLWHRDGIPVGLPARRHGRVRRRARGLECGAGVGGCVGGSRKRDPTRPRNRPKITGSGFRPSGECGRA